ncbi:MAG: hypothetical protein LBS33_02805 [Streptococcaceae bacterium]|nr:hypothetical protein [Streptococcaceae bacterium]
MNSLKYALTYWLKRIFQNFITETATKEATIPLSEEILSKIKLAFAQKRIIVVNYQNEDGDLTSISGRITRYELERNLLILEPFEHQAAIIKLSQIKKIKLLPKLTL